MISTERLSIVPLTLDDASFVLRLYNEPSFLQNIGDKGVRTLDDAKKNLTEGALASYQQNGYGMYKVQLHDGTVIGLCGLIKRDFLPHPDLDMPICRNLPVRVMRLKRPALWSIMPVNSA